MNESIYSYLKHFFVFIGFIFLSIAYFSPVINGKKIYQSDIVQYKGMAKQQIDYQKQWSRKLIGQTVLLVVCLHINWVPNMIIIISRS